MNTKYIFVTGGVASSLGKGIIAASLAKLLQARGLRVTIQKFDPYLNIDLMEEQKAIATKGHTPPVIMNKTWRQAAKP